MKMTAKVLAGSLAFQIAFGFVGSAHAAVVIRATSNKEVRAQGVPARQAERAENRVQDEIARQEIVQAGAPEGEENINTLHAALAGHRENFALVFNISVAEQDIDNNPDYAALLGSLLAGEAWVDSATFVGQLDAVVALDAGLNADTRRVLAGYVSEIPVATQTFATVAYGQALFNLVAQYDVNDLIAHYERLVAYDQNLNGHEARVQTVYGISIGSQQLENRDYLTVLEAIAAIPTYNAVTFPTLLVRATNFDAALIANNLRRIYAGFQGIPTESQDFTNEQYRSSIFAFVSQPGFNHDTTINLWIAINQLDIALDTHRSAFQTVYGVSLANQTAPSQSYLALLAGLVSSPGYNLATFPQVLEAAVSLHSALTANNLRSFFSKRYPVSQTNQNFSFATYRNLIFGIVGDPAYNQAATITTWQRVDALDIAFNGHRDSVRIVYGIPNANQFVSNDAYYNVLAGLVNLPNFEISTFPGYLDGAVALNDAVQNADVRDILAAFINVPVAEQVYSNGNYIGGLIGQVAGPNYNLTTYVEFWVDMKQVDQILSTDRETVQGAYGIPVADQRLSNPTYRQLVQDGVSFVSVPFMGYLKNAVELDRVIGAYGFRDEFEPTVDFPPSEQNITTNSDYRTALINLVAGQPAILQDLLDRYGVPQLREDLNRDGEVNRADLVIIARNLGLSSGATLAQGDLSGDGRVGVADIGLLQRKFGVKRTDLIVIAAAPAPQAAAGAVVVAVAKKPAAAPAAIAAKAKARQYDDWRKAKDAELEAQKKPLKAVRRKI